MSSICYGGSVRMKPEVEIEDFDPWVDEGYPHKIPKVYLEGWGEVYNRQHCFNWDDDSVIVVRNKHVLKYTHSTFVELLAKNEDGEIVWMDGRCAPYSDCWGGEYLNEERGACEYTIEEYNLETLTKRKYKVVLDEETELDIQDYRSLSNFVDADKLGSHFQIEDGVLLQYVGHNTELIIPEGVTELGYSLFSRKKEFESITMPSTLVKVYSTLPEYCRVKEIHVAEDNPKYYSKDGCLIDKETGELVWAYAATDIPCDESICKIGHSAFLNRQDLENIVIPENITEIGSYAFHGCKNMKSVFVSDTVKRIGTGAFYGCNTLSHISLPKSLTMINRNTFSYCSSLESILIPESVEVVDNDAFDGCDRLKVISVSDALVGIIEKSLDAKLVRKGDHWNVEHLNSSKKTSTSFKGFSF